MHWLTRRPWLLAPLGVVALLAWTPTDDGPTLCPFALVTGHACPGCGMTRALAYLLRGDVDVAVSYHPLAPLALLVAVVGLVWWWGRRRWRWPALPYQALNWGLAATGVLLLAVWLGRIASGTLPPV